MECLNIDFIFVGPFPDGGYILVIACTFTRWIELYHTLDATALSAAECLLKHFGCFGALISYVLIMVHTYCRFSAQLSGIFCGIIFGLGPVIFDQSASAFIHNMPRRG